MKSVNCQQQFHKAAAIFQGLLSCRGLLISVCKLLYIIMEYLNFVLDMYNCIPTYTSKARFKYIYSYTG